MNQHNNQLPVGLLAQFVECCIGISEVMGLNPVRAWIFNKLQLTTALHASCAFDTEDGSEKVFW